MKKVIFTNLLFFVFSIATYSQSEVKLLNGFSVGSSLAEGDNFTQVVLGQTFAYQNKSGGYEVSAGLPQAQLEILRINASVNEGDGYNSNGFSYPTTIAIGEYKDTLYLQNGSELNYDLLKLLRLKVLGDFSCGNLVYDGDLNEYQTVKVAGYCWTQSNIRALHYPDGLSNITKSLAYKSNQHPDENENENTFGRLYTWYSAVNVPENSSTSPIVDANGFVQGICPNGWHIPTTDEMAALLALSSDDIRSTELWVLPNDNNNSTLFTALPAGRFDSDANRFEGLLSETSFWSADNNTVGSSQETSKIKTLQFSYFCDTPLLNINNNLSNAISVRCVKNY